MMECWDIDPRDMIVFQEKCKKVSRAKKLGLGILQFLDNGNIGVDLKVRTDKIRQKPAIPSHQYSNIFIL